jgi:hypothetical protein
VLGFDKVKRAIKVRERSITWVVVRLAGQIASKTAHKEIRHNGARTRGWRKGVETYEGISTYLQLGLIYGART